MKIQFGLSREAQGLYFSLIERLAAAPQVRTVAEVGGGANPALSIDLVARTGIRYTVIDISATELAKAPGQVDKLVADVASPEFVPPRTYDLVFSQWLAEHVADAETFHRNVLKMLNPGGRAVHLFPTLYSPPFVLNCLMPERFAAKLLSLLQPHRESGGNHGKFPAYYRWCRGPTARQFRRFQRLGYRVEEYWGFFGHSGDVAFGAGYLDRIPALARAHEWVSRLLATRPAPWLTSIAYVVLQRPDLAVEPGPNELTPSEAQDPELAFSGSL